MIVVINHPRKAILRSSVIIAGMCVVLLSFSAHASNRLLDERHRSGLCVAAMIYAEFTYRTEEESGTKAGEADIQDIIQTDISTKEESILSPQASEYDYSLDAHDPQYIYFAVLAIRETFKLLFNSSEPPSSLNVMRYGFPSCMTALEQLGQRFKEKGQ